MGSRLTARVEMTFLPNKSMNEYGIVHAIEGMIF